MHALLRRDSQARGRGPRFLTPLGAAARRAAGASTRHSRNFRRDPATIKAGHTENVRRVGSYEPYAIVQNRETNPIVRSERYSIAVTF